MPSGQDVSEYLDTLGLVKSYFSSFLRKKHGDPTPPEDQVILPVYRIPS